MSPKKAYRSDVWSGLAWRAMGPATDGAIRSANVDVQFHLLMNHAVSDESPARIQADLNHLTRVLKTLVDIRPIRAREVNIVTDIVMIDELHAISG